MSAVAVRHGCTAVVSEAVIEDIRGRGLKTQVVS
jgi:hypothetical protein